MNTIVSIEHLEKTYTACELFDGIACYIRENEKLTLTGVNGTGKSTLLHTLAGEGSLDGDELTARKGTEIRLSSQNPQFLAAETALTVCLRMAGGEMNEEDTTAVAKKLLATLGVGGAEAICDTMLGDEKRRVAFAGVLLHPTDLLIPDEPTNHLDGGTVEWFKNYLKNSCDTSLMTAHNCCFLDSVCARILELDRGELYSYGTDYEGFLALEAKRLNIQQANKRTRQSILKKEFAWMQRDVHTCGTRSKKRIARYEKLSTLSGPEEETVLQFASAYPRLGKTTLAFHDVSRAYGGRYLFRDFSYQLQKNGRPSITGRSDAGKSAFLKLITRLEKPGSGEIKIGRMVKIGHFSQESKALSGELIMIENAKRIAESMPSPGGPVNAAKMLRRFLFPSLQHYMKVGKLSGGEE